MRLLASLPLLLPAALEVLAIPLPPSAENSEAGRVEYTQLLRFNGADLQNNLRIIPGASAVGFSTHTGPAGVEIGFDARTLSSPPPNAWIDIRSDFDFEYDLVVANINHVPTCAKASFGVDGNGNAIASSDSKPDADLPSISARGHQSSCKPTIHYPLSSILSAASAQNTGLVFAILRTDKDLQIYIQPGSDIFKERDLTTDDTQSLGKLVAELRGDDQCDIDSFSSQTFALGLDLGGGADAGCPSGAQQDQWGHGAYWGIESVAFYDRGNGQKSLAEELKFKPLNSEESESVGYDGSDPESTDGDKSETVEEKVEPESLKKGESLKEDWSNLEDGKDNLDEIDKSDFKDTPKEHSEETIENKELDYEDLNLGDEEIDLLSAKINANVDEEETSEAETSEEEKAAEVELETTSDQVPKEDSDEVSETATTPNRPDPVSADDVLQSNTPPKPENLKESDYLVNGDVYPAEDIKSEVAETQKLIEETIKEFEISMTEKIKEEETKVLASVSEPKEAESALDETETSSFELPSVENAKEADDLIASKQPSEHASAVPLRETTEEESSETVTDTDAHASAAYNPNSQEAIPKEVIASQDLVESPESHDADLKDGHKVTTTTTTTTASTETSANVATTDDKAPEKEFVAATRPEQQTTAEATDKKEELPLPSQQQQPQQQPPRQTETASDDTKDKEDKSTPQPPLFQLTSENVSVIRELKEVLTGQPAPQSDQPPAPLVSNPGMAGSSVPALPPILPQPAALTSDTRPPSGTSVKVKTGGLFSPWWRPRVKITRNP